MFTSEAKFEQALIDLLQAHNWEKRILKNYTEEQLIQNWADILFENNRGVDRLNDYPLTRTEMQQIMEQIILLKTPVRLNSFINGRSITIKRDNPDDIQHLGKEVSLTIYDRHQIGGGQSRYQIAQQPVFKSKHPILGDRRGDLMLLINGMPMIHIELKRSGVSIRQAFEQIKKYSGMGLFSGLFSLIQVFVVMNPEETRYFANPGPEGRFNENYCFHWADPNNEPINDWKVIATKLLTLPMVHQLVGYYTVADESDGVLKVMRSYQYYAVNEICSRVAKNHWDNKKQLGGYIWHTTGSGKTMTSFKAAQLIASSKDADKVLFLMDRVELGTQSLREYRAFADENEEIQATENTAVLVAKLKSSNPADTLIVTSIQKMGRIKEEGGYGIHGQELAVLQKKRIVFIVDECHRSTFGENLSTIKNNFPYALFFGFTGTPIQDENQKQKSTTAMVFGNELHRYSIADGIRDGNVLGFDINKHLTFHDREIRHVVALDKANASSLTEAFDDPVKRKIYLDYSNRTMLELEKELSSAQYRTPEHQEAVQECIANSFPMLSLNGQFHQIFATSSIPEALDYYRLFKKKAPQIKATVLVDPSLDNDGKALVKAEGLIEIIEDYNKRYGQSFDLPGFARMRKDIAARLAHKRPYERIASEPDKQIDLLIVVNQMLTGFDSKWVNTLHLDKLIEYENIIQAFSRTNRLFGPEKPHGIIYYYRKPYTMEQNIESAVKLYSGDKAPGLFVDKLYSNIQHMNEAFRDIRALFEAESIQNFERLPDDEGRCRQFVNLFNQLNRHMFAAHVQNFTWKVKSYFRVNSNGEKEWFELALNEETYNILLQRYKELDRVNIGPDDEPPYNLDGHISNLGVTVINSDYMNSRYKKFIKEFYKDERSKEQMVIIEEELRKSFASLPQDEQRIAELILHDIQTGKLIADSSLSFRDYINQYVQRRKDDQIHRFAECFGLDEEKLRRFTRQLVTSQNINDYGRFDELRASADMQKVRAYFENSKGKQIHPGRARILFEDILRKFVLTGDFNAET